MKMKTYLDDLLAEGETWMCMECGVALEDTMPVEDAVCPLCLHYPA